MKTICLLLAICIATVASLPRQHERIVGGELTTIGIYPFAVSLQGTGNMINFHHTCGATIINNRSALSAVHCWVGNPVPSRFRVRSGSSHKTSGGFLSNVVELFGHPHYTNRNHDNDIGVIRVSPVFRLDTTNVRVAFIAGPNFVIPDNNYVMALGWGNIQTQGPGSQQLRHVTLRSVNQARCNNDFGGIITANHLCASWPGGGRGICFGDSGTGLVFNNVVVGISSFIGFDGCGSARWPSVFARISRYDAWIRSHA